jgi:hypothetical protein
MIVTGRKPERLQNAARDLGALNTTTFDAIEANAELHREGARK